MNGPIRRVGIVVMLLLIGLVAQLSYLQIFHAQALKDNPCNTRRLEARFAKPRGEILSADGEVLARSTPTTDIYKYQREYPTGDLFSQVVGYHSLFRNTGVEAEYNDELAAKSKKENASMCCNRRPCDSASIVTYTTWPPACAWRCTIWLARMVLPAPGEPCRM